MKQILLVSYLSLLFLHIFDTYSTYILLSNGLATEANPIMAWCMTLIGQLPAMIIVKTIYFALLAWAYLWALKKKALNTIAIKECIAVYSLSFIMIGYYVFFMYTRNLQYLLIM